MILKENLIENNGVKMEKKDVIVIGGPTASR